MSRRKSSNINLDNIGDIRSIIKNLIKLDTADRIGRAQANIDQFQQRQNELKRRHAQLKYELSLEPQQLESSPTAIDIDNEKDNEPTTSSQERFREESSGVEDQD